MKETGVHITANGKKTVTQDVGTLWEFGFKVDPAPEVKSDQHHPVQVRVQRPDDQSGTTVPAFDGKAYAVLYALDVPGQFAATVEVTNADGIVSELGGFVATAEQVDDATLPSSTIPPVDTDPTPDAPAPQPADAD